MRFVRRRGLIVVLDVVNSTEVLVLRGVSDENPLVRIISRLAHGFWEAGAEVLAFTGDGLLAFFEDRGDRSATTWGLSDALRHCNAVAASAAMQDPRLRLRGAIHYDDILQLLDGPFVGQHIGRTILMVEEIAEAARQRDGIADHLVNILVTDAAHGRYPLPTHLTRVARNVDSQMLQAQDEFRLLDLPQDHADSNPASPDPQSYGFLAELSAGLIFFLKWKSPPAAPLFPNNVNAYIAGIGSLISLMCSCGLEVLNVTPLGVLGFSPCGANGPQWIQAISETLFGGEALARLIQVRELGWNGVTLRGGVVYGQVLRMLTGPLEGQSLGAHIAFAARFADKVANHCRNGDDNEQAVRIALPRHRKLLPVEGAPSFRSERAIWLWCWRHLGTNPSSGSKPSELQPYPGVRREQFAVTAKVAKNVNRIYKKAQRWEVTNISLEN
jgi:class 3 adenylate cyclase